MRKHSMKLAVVTIAFVTLTISVGADVVPPLHTRIEIAGSSDNLSPKTSALTLIVRTVVPDLGANAERRLVVTVAGEGAVRIVGPQSWEIQPVVPGKEYSDTVGIAVGVTGDGSVEVHVDSFDALGVKLWGRTDTLFVLKTAEELLQGRSSIFELKRQKLARERAQGVLSESEYEEELENLMRGRELRFERRMRVAAEAEKKSASRPVASAVATTTVSGRVTYTHRINRASGVDTFAGAAAALPVRRALVAFYDKNGATMTQIGPVAVRTDSTGGYSATVPGTRVDTTAVNLVVRVLADNDGARTGPIGQRTAVHSRESAAVVVTAASTPVDILVDATNLLALRAFALQDGMLTAFNFVVANNASSGVGTAPSRIFVEFPGTNANGSFFTTSVDDHLNIGQNHAFDWDVYTHEYGHYVQKINNTTQNPGGCHYINGNNTGFNQAACGGPNRVLTKAQATALAWGEGWPTFFGTNLQISSGSGALGIFALGDTRYTDTANNFSYDLEGNGESFAAMGEDNELSVQRILWDFADGPQDGHDELVYGNVDMWRQLAGDSAVVTLNAMRSKFDSLLPVSPKGYSVGGGNLVNVRQGRIYFDLNVGPEPLTPADNAVIAGTPPKFTWRTKGAGAAPSYRFNKFNVLFFTEDFATLRFTSPEITTPANATTGEWTPTAADWATIRAVNPTTSSPLVRWVVRGTNDTLAPATGPYYGLDRTLGSVEMAFVVDDTGSMSEEIGAVRAALTKIIADLRALGKSPLIELVTFKDDVTHRLTTNDLDVMQTAVNGLVEAGGGDCPESSVEALLEVSRDLISKGEITFATDASPHAGLSRAGIEAALKTRGLTFTVILTADCGPGDEVRGAPGRSSMENPNGDPAYVPAPRLDSVPDVYSDVACGGCPPNVNVGPALSENALKPIGDFTLVDPSAVVAYQEIAAASPAGTFLYYPGVNTGDAAPFENAFVNAALSAVIPVVIAVEPVDLIQGATMDVLVRGGGTNFQPSSTVAFSGGGVTVNSKSVLSPRTLKLNITVSSAAATGFRDVVVTTPLGTGETETTAGSDQARVVVNTGTPMVTSVSPGTIKRGTTTDVTITVVNVPVSASTTVTITNLIVNSITVLGPSSLRANVTAPPNAPLGFKTLDVTSGVNAQTQVMLSVIADDSPAATPEIAIAPATAARGAVTAITVTGTNTNFINGVTAASVSGTGVNVLSTTVTSPTSATVALDVAAGATLGFRDFTMTTVGEIATVTAGLLIAGVTPGDMNGDGAVTVADVFYLANAVFGGGGAPVASGDADGDGDVDNDDIQYLVDHLFAGGPPPH